MTVIALSSSHRPLSDSSDLLGGIKLTDLELDSEEDTKWTYLSSKDFRPSKEIFPSLPPDAHNQMWSPHSSPCCLRAVTDRIQTLQLLLAITGKQSENSPSTHARSIWVILQTHSRVPALCCGDRLAHFCGKQHYFQSASKFELQTVHRHHTQLHYCTARRCACVQLPCAHCWASVQRPDGFVGGGIPKWHSY